jgi:hypothetical protein
LDFPRYEGLVARSQLLGDTSLEVLPDYQPLGALTKAAAFVLEHPKQLTSSRSSAAASLAVKVENKSAEFEETWQEAWKPFKCPVKGCLKSYTHERCCWDHKKKMCVKC